MHLRSIALRGFKSFPDRTRLDFSPGVSVVVGPNGSGKSNITDAVLWALGEQSPLAVRGQTMQDVIFAGGHGVASRDVAEVEVVIDNADGGLASDFTELSIVRRLERAGEGEYHMNGARCRLVDVLEALSDTGLGREMHSVVSQGRVDAIVASRPRERRLLIEEAAGLGKHRKRRRRAQLKLERTEQNLSRSLDVEREARSRLRPLRRQAEAAELTRRLERQSLEARLELIADRAHGAVEARLGAEEAATRALAARDEADRLLAAVAARREGAERDFAAQARSREALAQAAFGARSAQDAVALRLERARDTAAAAADGARRRAHEHAALEREPAGHEQDREQGDPPGARVRSLEAELSALEAELSQRVEAELVELDARRAVAEREHADLAQEAERRRSASMAAESLAEDARATAREAEKALERARDRAAQAGGELAAVTQFLRAAGPAPGAGRPLAELVRVDEGYELALAAALGPLMRAAVAGDVAHAETLLDAAGAGGGSALLERPRASGHEQPQPGSSSPATYTARAGAAPAPGARRLLDHVQPAPAVSEVIQRLLEDVWVVESLAGVGGEGFSGVAVTPEGRLLVSTSGEVRQAPRGGDDRLVAEAGHRDRLIEASEAAARDEAQALIELDAARAGVEARDEERERARASQRAVLRDLDEAGERVGALERELDRRRSEPGEGAAQVRRAELGAELRAERRLAEQLSAELRRGQERLVALGRRIERDRSLADVAQRCVLAMQAALAAVAASRERLDGRLAEGEASADRLAAELRACAHEEAELQRRLRVASDALTGAEVTAQRARDAAEEAGAELERVAARLGLGVPAVAATLAPPRREELEARVERLDRRREQLGPVNPLAGEEYEAAVEHVEELERQRGDLESALGEVQRLIRDTDKLIRESFEETFAATARNFEEVVGHLFPGGHGRLALVHLDGPRPVLGDEAGTPGGSASEAAAEAEEATLDQEPGVEVEVTPAGKSTERLSLLSGGEKSLVALAFLFAVFLARPCPFYILDEVEAALDDINIDRFLQLVRRFSDRAQFIIVTHQKRTMDAADVLYGVSMAGDGVSKVVSRRLTGPPGAGTGETAQVAAQSRAVA